MFSKELSFLTASYLKSDICIPAVYYTNYTQCSAYYLESQGETLQGVTFLDVLHPQELMPSAEFTLEPDHFKGGESLSLQHGFKSDRNAWSITTAVVNHK